MFTPQRDGATVRGGGRLQNLGHGHSDSVHPSVTPTGPPDRAICAEAKVPPAAATDADESRPVPDRAQAGAAAATWTRGEDALSSRAVRLAAGRTRRVRPTREKQRNSGCECRVDNNGVGLAVDIN